MDNYVDKIEINEDNLKKEVSQWVKEFETKIRKEVKVFSWYTVAMWCSLFVVIAFAAAGYALVIIFDEPSFMFVVLASVAIGSFVVTYFFKKSKEKCLTEIKKYMESQNQFEIFQKWFSKNFAYDNLNVEKEISNSDEWIKFLVEKYKFRHVGSKIGVSETYQIMSGKIFNNPFDLSCGIYHSTETHKFNEVNFYLYMPVLQIKSNKFKDIDLKLTNNKKLFPEFKKSTAMFENKNFQEKFIVQTKNKADALLIFSPLIQEKWAALSDQLPDFQMHFKNGYIIILFNSQPRRNKVKKKIHLPFMNITKLYEVSFSWNTYIKKIDKTVINDLLMFTRLIDLVFSISLIQWENYEKQENINTENKKD